MTTAQDIIKTLALAPLPLEGGYYAETYRSAFGTAIYYLLTEDSYSAMHRLPGDEIFHFYLGDPVEMLQLRPDGTGEVLPSGRTFAAACGCRRWWRAGCGKDRGLLPAAPSRSWEPPWLRDFDFADYVAGDAAQLSAEYPQHADRIKRLTRT